MSRWLVTFFVLLFFVVFASGSSTYAFLGGGGATYPPAVCDEHDAQVFCEICENDDENDDDGAVDGGGDDIEPTAANITRIYNWNSDPLIIPLGADADAINALIAAYNANGIACRMDLDDGRVFLPVRLGGWDQARLDASVEDAYYPLTLDVPDGVVFEGQVEIPVWVLDPDAVTMRVFEQYVNSVYVTWLKEISEPELWISADGGDWSLAPADVFRFQGGNTLFVFLWELPELFGGSSYGFHVRYENDGEAVDLLRVDYADGGNVTLEPFGGDRTGEGRSEQARPPQIDGPPNEPVPEPVPVPAPAPILPDPNPAGRPGTGPDSTSATRRPQPRGNRSQPGLVFTPDPLPGAEFSEGTGPHLAGIVDTPPPVLLTL